MQAFVVLAVAVACASANPQLLVNNLGGVWGGQAIAYNTPYAHQVVSHAVPVATKTQYHAQDELGQASYGYAHAGQAHAAVRDAAGNVRGSYAYVNPEGKEVRVEYVADAGGFRVASNALPVGPVAGVPIPHAPQLIAPAQVQDTPEVIQARANHLAAHALARAGRSKRGVVSVLPSALGYSNIINHPINTVAVNHVASPYLTSAIASPYYGTQVVSGYSGTPVVSAYSASPVVSAYSGTPVVSAYSAPVVAAQHVREATLTKVVNTPGHAVSYRVD